LQQGETKTPDFASVPRTTGESFQGEMSTQTLANPGKTVYGKITVNSSAGAVFGQGVLATETGKREKHAK